MNIRNNKGTNTLWALETQHRYFWPLIKSEIKILFKNVFYCLLCLTIKCKHWFFGCLFCWFFFPTFLLKIAEWMLSDCWEGSKFLWPHSVAGHENKQTWEQPDIPSSSQRKKKKWVLQGEPACFPRGWEASAPHQNPQLAVSMGGGDTWGLSLCCGCGETGPMQSHSQPAFSIRHLQ